MKHCEIAIFYNGFNDSNLTWIASFYFFQLSYSDKKWRVFHLPLLNKSVEIKTQIFIKLFTYCADSSLVTLLQITMCLRIQRWMIQTKNHMKAFLLCCWGAYQTYNSHWLMSWSFLTQMFCSLSKLYWINISDGISEDILMLTQFDFVSIHFAQNQTLNSYAFIWSPNEATALRTDCLE